MTRRKAQLGTALREATVFLTRIHDDLWQLIRSLDALMAEKGWVPPKTTAVTSGLGNGLGAEYWVAQSVWRVYLPAREAKKIDDKVLRGLAICEFALAPKEKIQAACLCVAAEFGRPVAFSKVWEDWNWDGGDILSRLQDSSGIFKIPDAVLKDDFLPQATRAQAFVVPFADIATEQGLRQVIVAPLLDLLKS
jgi:hypothetical protein